jgi:hypothetical protein
MHEREGLGHTRYNPEPAPVGLQGLDIRQKQFVGRDTLPGSQLLSPSLTPRPLTIRQ